MNLKPVNNEPIVGLASGSLPSAVGLLRISGTDLSKTIAGCLDKPLIPRIAKYCNFVDLQKDGLIVDDVVATFFPGPNSYTGEDTLEIGCHGSLFVMKKVLSVLSKIGVRQATAGEFSQRAFLNGKMDLTQAEGVANLIASESEQQYRIAQELKSGKLEKKIQELRDSILGGLALIEARIDFPDEHDMDKVRNEGLIEAKESITGVRNQIESLLSTYKSGQVARQGLSVVIAGKPNSGKSTLLNELLGKDRALVSSTAGTTRDYIEESCLIDGRLIKIVDTAGIRESSHEVENQGIKLAKELARSADLVIHLVSSEEKCPPAKEFENSIFVLSKSDLNCPKFANSWIQISCLGGENQTGLEVLKKFIAEAVDSATDEVGNVVTICSERHKLALEDSLEHINKFFVQMDDGGYDEFLAFELMGAAKSLYSVIGDIENDDVLEQVFSRFCVGK